MKDLYPPIEPFKTEMLKVSELHSIYVEQCGNPKGIPVVFLHGGPGGGLHPAYRQFFDPKHWHVVLLDQRGCGKSTPFAELRENTTWDLVGDLEKIRTHLNIDRWAVFGGSWGSTLALSYAETYPQRCLALFLRGIFMMRKHELDWFYRCGTSRLFPDAWEKYLSCVKHVTQDQYIEEYYKQLTSEDRQVRMRAATAWSVWEATTSKLEVDLDHLALYQNTPEAEAIARIECHYMMNKGWFDRDDYLLHHAGKLKGIPGVIVHGRYDVICPAENAWELHRAWPESELHIVSASGHSVMEPRIRAVLVEATDRFIKQFI